MVAAVVSMAIAFGASADFFHQFSEFLTILLYLFTPWTTINLVDFYLVRHTHYSIREIFNPRGMYQRWSWRGLAAYGLGFVAMIPFMKTGIFDGPVTKLLDGTDLSMIPGLVVAAGVYWLACRSLDLEAEKRASRKPIETSNPAVDAVGEPETATARRPDHPPPHAGGVSCAVEYPRPACNRTRVC